MSSKIYNFNIKTFDPSKIDGYRTWLIIGARNTGKTRLLLDILYNTSSLYDFGVLLTGTTSMAELMSDTLPNMCIHRNGYDKDLVDRLVLACKNNAEMKKNRHVLFIFDDIMYDATFMKHKTQREIYMNGRHCHISTFTTTQYCMGIPPSIRSNIDYVIALKENIHKNIQKLYDHYFGIFDNFRVFKQVFEQCTTDYGAMIIDRTQANMSVDQCIFRYRANLDLPEFKIGRPCYFRFFQNIRDESEKKDSTNITIRLK